MAKTKFLSKVLAVLMALSMLCSTGVFADYNSGLTTAGGDAVTGEIALTDALLNDTVQLNLATIKKQAKWVDVNDGIKIHLAGTTSAQTGTLTYLIAPADVLEAVPLDVEAMQAKCIAINTVEIAGGAFDFTINVDKTKIEKDTLYELRYAYSKTEIADVTDASALVYQRYIHTYDWADATVKSTNVVNKAGIGDITIDIEANPLRPQYMTTTGDAYVQAPKYIRTANLQNGSILQFHNNGSATTDLVYGATEFVQTSDRTTIVMDVGSKLLGGVVMGYAGGSAEHKDTGTTANPKPNNKSGNIAYRFKATQSGTVYLVGNAGVAHPDWTAIENQVAAKQPYHTGHSSSGFLYVAPTEEGAEGTFTMMASKTAVAKEGVKLNESWYTKDRDLKLPTANLDANGNWQYGRGTEGTATAVTAAYAPYSMYRIYDFGTTDARGFVYQGQGMDTTFERTFEAGEWVEVPYPNTTAYAADAFAVVQFDVPKQPLTSATVVSTLHDMYAYNTSTSGTKIWPSKDGGTETITFPAGTEEAVIEVPYGTATATATITNALGASAEVTATFGNAKRITTDTFETTVEIGGETYEVTIKWDDTYPYILNYVDNKAYYAYDQRNFVMRADGVNQIWASSQIGNKLISGTYHYEEGVAAEGKIANAGAANTNIVINGEALANNGYLSAITVNYSDAFYRAKQHPYTDDFHEVAHIETDQWTTFVPSANGTVYVTVTHANAGTKSFVWKEGAAAGWTREESATFNDAVVYVYSKRVTAGETVKVPSQVITQEEIDYINTKLAAKDAAANDGYNYRYILTDETGAFSSLKGVHAVMQYSTDGGATWTNIVTADSSTGRQATVKVEGKDATVQGDYLRGQNNGANTRTGAPYGRQNFFLVVAFDQPFAMGDVSYTIGEDTEVVDFAGATEKTITIPYGTESVSLDAAWSGAGEVVVEPATLTFSDAAATQTATITATPASGAATTYSVTFKWGAPTLIWESALAPTGTLNTHEQGPSNRRRLYDQGLYKVGEQSGSVQLSEDNTTIDLVVPYGVEVVKMNGGVSVNLLAADNHAVSTTLTLAGVEYTVNVSWAPYVYDATNTEKPLIYDLEYFVDGKTALYADSYVTTDSNGKETTVKARYYAIPTNLVLDADHDLVYGTGDLKGTNASGKLTVDQAEGTWFTNSSHTNINLSSTNKGAAVNRLHLAPKAFETWVENGDLDSIYALNGATYIAADYDDVVANGAVRYRFKTATAGYVIIASRNANTALTAADGWTRLEGNKLPFTNGSTSANSDDLKRPPEGHTNAAVNFATWTGACNYIYIKKVDANEVIEVKESAVESGYPPVVIVATEDMINERVEAPTLLASLSYTTALAVTSPKDSDAANARGTNKKSLHAGGYYQPTLVTEAATVEVAEDATTVNVTVPYGSEIVNLSGVDTKAGAVTFDGAINLINNNGAVTLTKTVGEVEYTINVAWAQYDASADPAGNMVYDVKYRVKDLAASGYYNAVPTKLSLTEARPERGTYDLYTDATLAKVAVKAGKWVLASAVNGVGSNALVHNNGGTIARGRFTVDGFANWVKSGLVTVNGIPAVPNAEDVDTEAEVDAIAYAAMNGATTFVAHYQDLITKGAAAGANADMDARMSFRVAQDSIIYVSSAVAYNPGEGWMKYEAGALTSINYNARGKYFMAPAEEGGEPTESATVAYDLDNEYAGSNVYYRYARAGELVTLATEEVTYKEFPPVVIVRAMDLSDIADPTVSNFSYTAGNAEAAGVEFEGSATTATITVPYGTESVSLNAVMSGAGSLTFSDALTLSRDNREGTITATLKNIFGTVVATYEVTFVWGAAPAVESLTYSTARTLYKGAVETDKEITAETQTIEVPWGTDSVTVSYKVEGQEPVALKAVSVASGTASVEVDLPEGTITLTFVYGTAPAGQYITNLTKIPNNWRDRMFVSYGDVDNAYTAVSSTAYTPTTASPLFFADGEVYSSRVPAGLAKKGEVAVIADAAANTALTHMTSESFPYMYNATYSVGTDATNSWISFVPAKDGMVYVAPASADMVWKEGEAAGWTVAPFTMVYGRLRRTVYQKSVTAGETVYVPNDVVDADEIAAVNATLEHYTYVQVTQDDIDTMKAAVKAAEGKNDSWTISNVNVGDYVAKYNDDVDLTAKGVAENYAGFIAHQADKTAMQFKHYTRDNYAVTFVVAEDSVADEVKNLHYTGASTLAADGEIALSANPAYYGEKNDAEITFEIKSGAEYASIVDGKLVANRQNWVPGASVVLTMKQGDAEKDVTISILPIDLAKYGYLTIVEGTGVGIVTGTVNGDPVIEDTTAGAMEFAIGTPVVLEATAGDGYEFAYWARVGTNGETVYNRDAKFTLAVPNGITLKPIFKAVAADTYTVTFLGYQNKIINSYDLASTPGDTIEIPDAPEVFGYTFLYYEAAGMANCVEGELAKALFDKDVTYSAVYERKAEMNFTLTVVNGTIKGTELASTEVKYNEAVTVVAAAPAEGKVFMYWVDENEQKLSYTPEYRFYMAAADREITAVYGEKAVAVAPVVTMTVTRVEENASGPIYGLFAERRVPKEIQVLETGIVYGAKDYRGFTSVANTADADTLNLNTYVGKKTSSYQNNNGQYTIRIQMTDGRQGKGDQWYARTYLTYMDTDGTIKTMYSDHALIYDFQSAE